MHLTDEQYIISALSQAIAHGLPIEPVTIAWEIATTGQQFDAALSAAIELHEIVSTKI